MIVLGLLGLLLLASASVRAIRRRDRARRELSRLIAMHVR